MVSLLTAKAKLHAVTIHVHRHIHLLLLLPDPVEDLGAKQDSKPLLGQNTFLQKRDFYL